MIFSILQIPTNLPAFLFSKKSNENKGDVDKGTTRKTPGNGEGARPPKKEEYKEDEMPHAEEVDNQYKDRLKKNRETRPDELIEEEGKKKAKK